MSPSVRSFKNESGNIFFAIFGAIVLVGILSASLMTFMKGPLSTAVKLTKMNTAETQMTIGAQVAVMSTTSQANSGDCDSDGFVEPQPWRAATTEPVPTNGGLVPLSLGISKKDPWGTEYGYCVWNHGSVTSGGTCGANMLPGTNSTAYPVVAIISAGPDKAFTTTCRNFASADTNSDGDLDDAADHPLVSKAAETDDDIIQTFTYEEATAASGGLWSLKSGDPTTAVISKKIQTSGNATFGGVGTFQGGVLLPSKSLITCDATTAGVMAKNASGTGIEICDGTGSWTSISGGGSGASSSFATSAATCSATTAGQVRYNSTSGNPEFCNGTAWVPFALSVTGVNLVISPTSSSSMNVDGNTNADSVTCTVASGMYCGAAVTFTVTNQGTATSAALVWRIEQVINGATQIINLTTGTSPTNATNFVVTSNTCSGATLAPNATCAVVVRPKSNGNTTYTGAFRVTSNNAPIAVMQGAATNFGCYPGRQGGGGKYAACSLSSTEGTYDLIVQPGGCTGTTTNPTCAGGNDTVSKPWASSYNSTYTPALMSYIASSVGALNSVNAMQIYAMSPTFLTPDAIKYCDDMVYGGYSDWYLPSNSEMSNYLYPNKTAIGGFGAGYYWSSKYSWWASYPVVLYTNFSDGTNSDSNSGAVYWVRCVRRDNIALPTATSDIDPDAVAISPAVSFSSGGTATSNTVTVTGILQTISVSMTGGTGMNIVKNGVSTGASSISGVKLGDTLAFQMNAPTTLGTKSTATINIGTDTYSWWAGYADSSKVARVFVTSTGQTGALGGLTGADSLCETRAAASSYGLPSGWKAVLSTSAVDAADRISWNWGTLKTVTGATVVDGGFPDLWDGTLDGPINITELGTSFTTVVWTSSLSSGRKDSAYSFSGSNTGCNDFTTANNSTGLGSSVSVSSTWIYNMSGNSCGSNYAIYCMEDIDGGSDVIPNAIDIPYNIQVATSSRQSSSTVVISSMSNGATTTLAVSATGGNPAFTVNGGSEVTSATVQNGDSIVFKMDAPATGNSSNKMTITSGGSTTLGYWRVWTGDTTGTAVKRIFAYQKTNWYCGLGGLSTADSNCTSAASSAGLGGSWKAIISGYDEPNWAINRVGYNWTTLRGTDGNDIVMSGNIWSTASSPLLAPVVRNAANTASYSTQVFTNTKADGKAKYQTSTDTCDNWTITNWNSFRNWFGTSSVTSGSWLYNGTSTSNGGGGGTEYFYCIEQ